MESEISTWRQYREKLRIASYAYDEAKEQEVFDAIPAFLAEARYVLSRLKELSRSLD